MILYQENENAIGIEAGSGGAGWIAEYLCGHSLNSASTASWTTRDGAHHQAFCHAQVYSIRSPPYIHSRCVPGEEKVAVTAILTPVGGQIFIFDKAGNRMQELNSS